MTALLRYHGFSNWTNHFLENENERDNILFGFELEAREDITNYNENQLSPEKVADKLQDEFGNLFVYERDGSIGRGIEIISNPMTMGWYMKNTDKFKIIAYTFSGLFAGIAAIFWAASFSTVATATGNGMELDAIAGVYIGGTSAAGCQHAERCYRSEYSGANLFEL